MKKSVLLRYLARVPSKTLAGKTFGRVLGMLPVDMQNLIGPRGARVLLGLQVLAKFAGTATAALACWSYQVWLYQFSGYTNFACPRVFWALCSAFQRGLVTELRAPCVLRFACYAVAPWFPYYVPPGWTLARTFCHQRVTDLAVKACHITGFPAPNNG